ncbi:putative Two component Sensor/histidine kinase [Vibrio crassostreae]|uniref:sensor domain-containing diguanylate cyclase n=1 Tax=Vibrio crassostreae TaxID=246167 RepID=UPI0005E4ED83|nr:diguanylate cyclase [Vibrio crassostreae]TCT60120.1 PAS domain S-box-containing protein/diguanylate cyclase (GGDEF)-like protein [Vibrio crassostreae]TCT81809.1 PAS domain S-box-containing protein/diguanylate cyclase (GGDEF)-like protein [Vibrio crassostreae]TCU04170.1 PAS domain S-box-containing protein/diguanylate cyclase (GGDEF)-like protein [Vibrio crassostreae]TDW06537.1 PAS domain S-box-containing protein/diguanylate cyclase (GGDEF)-like protein [Vibrio crassostreae]CAK1767821.1 putat
MRNKKSIITLLIISIILSSAVCLYYLQRYKEVKQESFDYSAKQAVHQLVYAKRDYDLLKTQLVSVMELLSHSQSLVNFASSPSDQTKYLLEEVWQSVLVNQKWYTQIHLLDITGKELVRVNYSSDTGRVTLPQQLQDRSDSNYFQYAQKLEAEQIGGWGIELETEHGEVTFPYSPVIRVFTPVETPDKRVGYLVINLDVWGLSSRLSFSPDNDLRSEVVNEAGYFIASNKSDKLFGDAIPERKGYNLKNIAPKTWDAISNEQVGYVFEGDNLFAFNTVMLANSQKVHLLIQLNQKQLMERAERDLNDLAYEEIIVLITVLIFAFPFAYLVTHYRRRSLESKLARAALNGMSAVMISDKQHRTMMINNEFENMTGYCKKQVIGQNALQLLLENTDQVLSSSAIWSHLEQEEVWEGEVQCKNKLRIPFTAIMRVHVVKNNSDKVSYYITSLVDISVRKELEVRLRILSERDSLSNLWNRRKFEEQLAYYSRLVERYPNESTTCLALVDIDNFKRINDELGHDEGDRVIASVAKLLQDSLRGTDFVARVGGEEFALLMPHTSLSEAKRVLDRLRIEIELAAGTKVTVSVGFTDLTSNSTRSYKCADVALYESKSSGRNTVSMCPSYDDVA